MRRVLLQQCVLRMLVWKTVMQPIRYCSTRGGVSGVSFVDAVLSGLASDGGLLLPERVPLVPPSYCVFLKQLSYRELFLRLLQLYITEDEIPAADLKCIVDASCAKFRTPNCVDYAQIQIDDQKIELLELFHGPTFAFKDFALQFVGRLLEYLLESHGQKHATVIAATSGDTGSAAIAAFEGIRNVSCCILFPEGKTSHIQELQMTTSAAPNVHCVAVQEAAFDDCQTIVKQLLQSPLKQKLQLTAVNSINWARILAQTVYYWHASLRSSSAVFDVVVPTGNFGNALAAFYAKLSGAPIRGIITASNSNDALPRYALSGVVEPLPVVPTMSPAMDIQIPSNLERGIHLAEERSFADLFLTFKASEEDTATAIRRCWTENRLLLDPHTAVGVHCALQYLKSPLRPREAAKLDGSVAAGDTPAVGLLVVATAHCGKFSETLAEVVGPEIAYSHVPPSLRLLQRLPQRKCRITATADAVTNFLVRTIGTTAAGSTEKQRTQKGTQWSNDSSDDVK